MFTIEKHAIFMPDVLYIEVSQSSALKFAAAEVDLKNKKCYQLFHFIRCRDYFAEVIYGSLRKKDYTIFGFSWPGSKFSILAEKTGLLLENPDKDFLNNLPVLNKWEEKIGFKPTVCYPTDQSKVLLVTFDPAWWTNSFMISMYTLILRTLIGEIKEISPLELSKNCKGNDKYMLEAMGKNDYSKKIFNNPKLLALDNDNMGWPKSTQTATVHNYGGIYSFLSGYASNNNNYKAFKEVA